MLPPKGDGLRWANSDPVTGQAAWYDLKVRVEKAEPGEDSVVYPEFDAQQSPGGLPKASATLRYGEAIIAKEKSRGDRS